MEKKVQRNFLWIALLVLGTIWILARHNRTQPYYTVNGLIFDLSLIHISEPTRP